jgi:hypothetical protein
MMLLPNLINCVKFNRERKSRVDFRIVIQSKRWINLASLLICLKLFKEA